MCRAPARSVRACFVRKWCTVVVQENDLRTTTLQCQTLTSCPSLPAAATLPEKKLFRPPASSLTHVPCNIHAATTTGFAAPRGKAACIFAHGNRTWQESRSHYNVICNNRFPKSPLPDVTISRCHHFPMSPLPDVTTSLFTTSFVPKSPLPKVTSSLSQHKKVIPNLEDCFPASVDNVWFTTISNL